MKEEFLNYKLNNMSIHDKIGQMIMVDFRDTLEMNTTLEKVLTEYNPGGFILFKSNIGNYKQTEKLIHDVKTSGDISLLVSTDQEGGRVQRLDERVGFEKIPPMMEIGNTGDTIKAFNIGKKIGEELHKIGIDMDMVPIIDIYSNPLNRVIGDRSFGTNSEIVKKMGVYYARGLQSKWVIPVFKHFPGHGDTAKDSHIELPITEKSLDELMKLELIPFIEAINNRMPVMMIGHIAVPKITKNSDPASLSKIMIKDILRDTLGYKGIVISDSLKIKGITNYFTSEDIYLRSIIAGNNILLMPQDISIAYKTIYEGIDSGKISIDLINDSVLKILNLKFEQGFFNKEYEEYIVNKNRKRR